MKIAKYMIVGMCFLLLVTGCGKVPKLANGKEVVAEIKGYQLTADGLYAEMKSRYARNIIIDLIDRTILDSKYPTDNSLTAEVNNQIDSIKQQTGEGKPFLDAIKSQWGFDTEDELFHYIELSYKRTTAIDDYIRSIITDKEIQDYYDTKTVGDIKISHILIKPAVTDDMTAEQKTAKENEALAKAKDIIKELVAGAKFADLAKKYSEDTGSAANGGDVGWFNKGTMDPAFEEASYKLQKNEYTLVPVKSQFGYHIILRTDTKAKPTLKEAKESIIKSLIEEKLKDDTTLNYKALDELRKSNKLVIHDSELKNQYDAYMKELMTK
jgi:foldase protein PrsA